MGPAESGAVEVVRGVLAGVQPPGLTIEKIRDGVVAVLGVEGTVSPAMVAGAVAHMAACGDIERTVVGSSRPVVFYALVEVGAWRGLTRRERQLAELIVSGKGREESSATLCVSPKTYDTHRQHVMRKLGVANEVMLVHLAISRGWSPVIKL